MEKPTEFFNSLDATGNIQFTYEVAQDGNLPFLDILLQRTDSGGLKLCIYRKPTHTDQYLNFSSHFPVVHKLSVVKTVMEKVSNWSQSVKTKRGPPSFWLSPWSFSKVRRQLEFRGDKRKKKNKTQEASMKRPMFVIPMYMWP